MFVSSVELAGSWSGAALSDPACCTMQSLIEPVTRLVQRCVHHATAVALAVDSEVGLLPSLWCRRGQGGDSGELVAEACHLGVAHPPGYPLFVLLGHVATLLPFPDGATPAVKVNGMNALLGTGAAVALFATVHRLLRLLFDSNASTGADARSVDHKPAGQGSGGSGGNDGGLTPADHVIVVAASALAAVRLPRPAVLI